MKLYVTAAIWCAAVFVSAVAHPQRVTPDQATSTKAPGPMPNIDGGAAGAPSISSGSKSQCPVAEAIVPFDPTAPISAPGPLPAASRPALDVVGATASFDSSGTKGTLVFAPFAVLSDSYNKVLSETRIELRTGFGDTQTFGGSLSSGYSTASRLSAKQTQTLQALISDEACKSLAESQAELTGAVAELARQFSESSSTALKDCARNVSAEPTDLRGAELATCFSDHKERLPKEEQRKGQELTNTFLEKAEDLLSDSEMGWLKTVRGKRLEMAFDNAVMGSVKVSLDAFPFVDGPDATEGDSAPRKPIPNEFSAFSVTGSFAYFASERFGFWLTGGLQEQRPTPADALSTRILSSLEMALNFPVGDFDDNGFRTGTAIGFAARWGACRERIGCKEKILAYPKSIATDHVMAAIPFFDVRPSSSLQFRFSVPITYYKLTTELADGEDNIVTVLPTLSTSVSKWKTEVK